MLTYNHVIHVLGERAVQLVRMCLELIENLKTKGFQESEEDPTVISLTPVYRYNRIMKAANKIVKGTDFHPYLQTRYHCSWGIL